MYKIPLPEIKEKLVRSGKITSEELEQRLKKKINDLAGLISEEGAAHIIANELGIELFAASQGRLKAKEVYAGMRDVSIVGKVMRKFEMREFAKGESTGKVCSFILGDETGTIRIVLWNEQVELANKFKEEDIVLISNAYVRENRDNKEIHLGNRGELVINPHGEKVGPVKPVSASFSRKKIEELKDGEDGVELMGTVVQVFDPRFFNICSECGRKVTENEGNFFCADHQQVTPSLSYVLNLILDDGTGTIRVVFWKNQVNHLLGKAETELATYREDLSRFEGVKNDLLGEQFKLIGRVKRNDLFDRLEFNVQMVEKANAVEEMAKLEGKSS
ncbi:MAG: OB-fold nucleic acid binding domain-containing protein [Nanoarchaeota archaeon]